MASNTKPRPDAADGHELLDVVDSSGRVVGAAPRKLCHGNPALAHRAVHVIVRNRAGQYFLQKRSRSKQVQPGKWDSAVGGHLAPGETYDHAAARELREELGIRDAPLHYLHGYVWRTDIETEHVRTYLLTAEGPFRLDKREIEDGRFWTVSELRSAAGKDVLTPNLEEELERLGVL